jgi:hypothetical protein
MTEYVQLPNGGYFPLKEGENAREALMEARKLYPDAFGIKEEIAPTKPPKEGLMSDLTSSAKNLLNISKTGIGALTGDTTQAALEGKRRQEKLSEEYKSGFNPQAIADKWNEGKYLGAAGEALSQVPSAVASIAPSVGQEIGLAGLGRIGGGAIGALTPIPGGAAIGAQAGQYVVPAVVNFIQALGSQAQEKVKAQVEAGEKPDVSALELAPYAAANAALNLVGTKVAMPGVFKKAIGQKVAAETADETRKALLAEAGKIAGRGTLNTIGRGIGGFALGELPTEVLQDVVDRAAIGKPLADDDALKQYRDTTFNMLLASPLGGAFGVQQRAGARQTVAKDAAEKQALQTAEQQKQAQAQAQQAAADEAARKQSPEYAQEVEAKYQSLLAQKKQLDAIADAPTDKNDLAAQEAKRIARKQRQELLNAPETKAILTEYNEIQARRKATAAEPTQAQMFPEAQVPNQAETDLFGAPVARVAPEAPTEEAPDYQRQVRTLTQQLEELQTQAKGSKDLDQKIALGAQYAQIKTALEEARALAQKAPKPVADQIGLLRRKMEIAEDEGDVETQAKIAAQLKELGVADITGPIEQTNIPLDKQKNFSETTKSFNARVVGPEIAAGREAAAAQTAKLEADKAALQRMGEQDVGEEYARQSREERQNQLEVQQMEKQAEMNKGRTDQLDLFGTGETVDQKLTLEKLKPQTGSTRGQLIAALQIARIAGDRTRVSAIAEQLRDMEAKAEAAKTKGATASTLPTTTAQLAEDFTGSRLPPEMAKQQAAADARARAFADIVGLISRYNKGQAKRDELDEARKTAVKGLVADIESTSGRLLTLNEQLQIEREANSALDELINRFGDTRNMMQKGTSKKPLLVPAQNEKGEFVQQGQFPTVEGAAPGQETFANPFEGAMQIRQRIEDIRQRFVSGQQERTPVTTTITPENATQGMVQAQLESLLARGPASVGEDHATAVELADNLKAITGKEELGLASDWLYRVQNKLANPYTGELKALLARLEQGKRSETETVKGETKRAVQGELPAIPRTGTVFNTPEEFDNYLASDALQQERSNLGMVRRTVSRLRAAAAPFAKKAEALKNKLVMLQIQYGIALDVKTEEVDLAKQLTAEARANLRAITDRLDEELRGLQVEYIQANIAFSAAADKSAEVSAAIDVNAKSYSEPEEKARIEYAKSKQALYEAINSPLAKKLHPKIDAQDFSTRLKAAKDVYKEKVVGLQTRVLEATTAYRMAAARNQTQSRIVKFLDVDLDLQMQLNTQMAQMDELSTNLLNASLALELAKQQQSRSTKNKAALQAATADLDTAVQLEQEAIKAQQAQERAGNLAMAQPNRLLRAAERAVAAPDIAARNAQEASVRQVEIETLFDREERDRELRRIENELRSNLAEIPGAQISFQKRRDALDLISTAEEKENAFDTTIADCDKAMVKLASDITLQENNIAEAKAVIDKISKVPEAKRSGEQMADLANAQDKLESNLKNLTNSKDAEMMVQTLKDDAQKGIVRLQEKVASLERQFSNDPEVAEAEWGAINKRIDKLRNVTIPRAETKAAEPKIGKKLKESRVKELGNYRRELDKLEKRRAIAKGINITPIGGPRETSRVEAGTRLSARKIGPVVKKTVQAGNVRTGVAETLGERMLSTQNKVTQGGAKRPVTGVQAQRAAGKDVGFEQAMLELGKISDLREKLEVARDKATEENDTAKLEKLDAYEKRLDKAQKVHETKIDKYRPVLRTAVTSTGPSIGAEQVTRIANDTVKDWAKVPNIEVVDNVEDLLPRIQTQLREENDENTEVPGLYDPQTDTVFLISSALRSGQDVVYTIMHEVSGHYGLRNMLGGTYTKTMNEIYNGNRSVREEADAKMKANPKLSREIAVEEVLADTAEDAPYANQQMRNALRRFIASIKQWLRDKGLLSSVSDFEVNQLVADARKYVRQGVGGRGGEVTQSQAVLRTAPKYESENAFTDLAGRIVAQPKTFKERMGSNLALEAEMQLVDMRAGLREALKAGAAAMGDIKLFTQSMYNVLKADQSMPLVSAVLSDGALEIYTDAQGLRGIRSTNKDSAKDVFDAIAKIPAKNEQGRMALATTYMIAQRAANKGLTALDLGNMKLTQADLDAALAAADADPVMKKALEEVRAKYNAYNEGQIRFLAASGSIPKKLADDLLKEGDYVPYYRVLDDGTAQLVYGGEKTITIGDIRHQPYLQELKGGDTKILPLNESIPRNTMLLTKKALTNLATKEIAYAMQTFGEGKGEIDPKTGKAKNLMAIHSGRSPGGSNVIVFNQEPDPKDPKDDGQRWLRVDTKGTAMEGIPSELVVQSLEGSHLTLPAFLKIGGYAGDLLRKGVTRMPPYILRQLYRDPMAATFTSGLNYNPLTAVLKAGKEFIAMNRGESKTGAELIRKGLIQSGIFTGDPSDISAFALQLASGKDQSTLDKLLAMTDRAAMRADASTRALVYDNAIANGLSEVEADMMVMESMNFYKRGLSPTVQYANRLIPFMNAQIQGLNVLYKAATGKMPFNERQEIQRKFFNNAMMLAATGVVYAMAMEDDKYFRNAKPKEKYSNFFMHLPGVEEPLKLAIPYEAGWFFSAGVAVVDAMKAETDGKQQFKAVRDMFLNAVPGYSSMYMPQAVKPLFEVWSNKNFFSGYNIESPTMQNKRIEDRYLSSTTEAAKALSRMLPILSPIQIEHITRAYFGALPLAVMAGTGDMFAKPSTLEKPAARITDVPIIGSMFQKEFGGADADVVYNLAKDAIQTQASFGALKKSGNFQDVKDFAQEHRAELVVAPMAKMFQTNMNRLRTQEDIVVNRLNLSPAEKRVRIDAIEKARQDMAFTFMQRIKQAEERVGKTIPQ